MQQLFRLLYQLNTKKSVRFCAINFYIFILLMAQIIIADEYKVLSSIVVSSSCQIFSGVSLKNGKTFAIKWQSRQKSDSVLREATILMSIQQKYNFTVDYGMPYCHAAGKQNNHNYSLLDLLSHNLHTLLHKCGGIFKIKTFLMIADQTLKLIEFLHRQGYIHRQVSLKKFAIGSAKNSKKLYLCGLGQGKRFKKEGEQHIAYKEGVSVKPSRSLKYLSINRQLGIEASRRDDLESLMYCWVKMLYGKLPWQQQTNPEKMLSKKIQNSGAVIFASFPKQLQDIYDHCRGLSFSQEPKYQFMRAMVQELLEVYNLEYDYDYDWESSVFEDKTEQEAE